MRRSGIFILFLCVIISGCEKEHVEMDVFSSQNIISDNWYELNIDVIVDDEIASDEEECSREIIQHIVDNDFYNMRFSFDMNGYPNKVNVNVFTTEKNLQKDKKAYSFEYVTEFNTENIEIQNNIKDNPEEFRIQFDIKM